MKLLPPPSYARKAMRSDDSLGRAMEAAFTMLGFFGIGFALDRWLGTTPVFMIVCTVLAAVGLVVGILLATAIVAPRRAI